MFGLFKMDKANTPIIKQLPAAAATYSVGQVAVVNASGYVTAVSGTTKPTHVVVEKGTKTTADTVSVVPIYPDQEYVTTLSTAGTLTVGAKVTIASDFAQVTATTTSGVATVIEATGSTSGSTVIVKFD
jgi:hypothetical protein